MRPKEALVDRGLQRRKRKKGEEVEHNRASGHLGERRTQKTSREGQSGSHRDKSDRACKVGCLRTLLPVNGKLVHHDDAERVD